MSDKELEKEVKFYVNHLEEIEARIIKLDINLVQPRTFEYNLLFDNESGDFETSAQKLRLRRDIQNTLTYKGPGEITGGVFQRNEIEIRVSDFDQTRSILQALGYQVSFCYEKYRSVYKFDGTYITLDETPIGNFVEIEGREFSLINHFSQKIGLSWENRILCSYLDLFNVVNKNISQVLENLTFSDFGEIIVTPAMLGVLPADF